MWSQRRLSIASIGAVTGVTLGCSPAQAPPAQGAWIAPPSSAGAPVPAIDPATISIAAVRAPERLAIDGDLGEWGALATQATALGSASRLELALTPLALSIGAVLDGAARDGILVGIAAEPAEVPPSGSMFSSWSIESLDCKTGGFWLDGTFQDRQHRSEAQIADACRVLGERHAKLVAEHTRRFSRVYRVDREGVRSIGDDGRAVAIPGAETAWGSVATRASVEVRLPLAALPRVAEAPITRLAVWARPATSPPPDVPAAGVELTLPAPVSIEPFGELRARVFGALVPLRPPYRWVEGIQVQTAGLSYQPGDPLHVESLHYADTGAEGFRQDTATVIPRTETLYERLDGAGDVEVGVVHTFVDWLAIFEKGKLRELVSPDEEPGCDHESYWRGAVQRDGAVHAFAYRHGVGSSSCGQHLGDWVAIAVLPDGSRRWVLPSSSDTAVGCEGAGRGATAMGAVTRGAAFATKTFDAFGWRGEVGCYDPDGIRPASTLTLEVTYRWDAVKKQYVARWRHAPAPSKKVR